MDNLIIQSFKNQLSIKVVLKELNLDYDKKNEDAVFICPFHKENTASFHMNLDTGLFNCFGCGTKGADVISFIQQYKVLGFVQSLEVLAELCNIPLPQDVEEIDKNELIQKKLIRMKQTYLSEALDIDYTPVYQFLLNICSEEKAIEYLHERGIENPELVAKQMQIRVIENYDKVNQALLDRFSIRRLIAAGLMGERQNLLFYNHKLLLPFFVDDDIPYISARSLDNECKPKYKNLNNRTIPTFYNANDLLENDTIFLCEGQTDTLSIVGLSLPTIGIAGATNIDIKTLEILSDKNIILAFDNDKAGQTGEKKLIEILKYIAKSVTVFEKEEKDMNEHLQNKNNKIQLKEFYETIRTHCVNR